MTAAGFSVIAKEYTAVIMFILIHYLNLIYGKSFFIQKADLS